MADISARQAFLALFAEAKVTIAQPHFYDTLTANCTIVVFRLTRPINPGLTLDRRILVWGYLPDHAYDHCLLDKQFSLAELHDLGGSRSGRSRPDGSAEYSAMIRVGIPAP
jgi:hypothetical protein